MEAYPTTFVPDQVEPRALAPPRLETQPAEGQRWSADAPVLGRGVVAVVEALLKSPASILREVQEGRGASARLSLVVAASAIVVGLVTASFSGGLQFVLVPMKMVGGVFFCALICLPSLHIFSCLSGARQSLKETWGALLMGVALMGLLLLGFAPIAWIFSQATSSVAFVGGLHLLFLTLSCVLGLRLVDRTLAAMNRAPLRGLRMWSTLFVVVLFQMSTTLRPFVGAADGVRLEERLFFLTHWVKALAS